MRKSYADGPISPNEMRCRFVASCLPRYTFAATEPARMSFGPSFVLTLQPAWYAKGPVSNAWNFR